MKTEEQTKNFNEQEYYLELLLEQIQCQKAKGMVEEEIRNHIDDQKSAYMAKGMEEQEAEKEAVRQMGDPVETGIRLDKIHRPQMAWDILLLVIFLSGTGLVIQYLLGKHLVYVDVLPNMVPNTGKAILGIVLGILAAVGLCMLDYSRIGKWAKAFYLALVGLAIFRLIVTGGVIAMGDMYSYTAVWTVPLYGAILYSYKGQGYRAVGKSILWLLLACIIPVLNVKIPVLMVIVISDIVLLSVAIYKNWFCVSRGLALSVLWAGSLIMPAALTGLLYLSENGLAHYQKARLQVLLHPFSLEPDMWGGRFVPQFLEYNRFIGTNSLLVSGEWEYSLPPGNYYTLAYVSCYYGILAAIILAGLILLLIFRGFHISVRQKNQMGMIMGTGCMTVLLVMFLLYVLCNAGILPVSICCPFLTYGVWEMLIISVPLGILLSIYRYQNVLGERDTYRVPMQ